MLFQVSRPSWPFPVQAGTAGISPAAFRPPCNFYDPDSQHLPPAQVSHLESFFQRCPRDAHFSHANARITKSPKLSKSHFPQFHYLPFKNTQPDHKKTRLLLPVQPGGCSNSAPLSFIQVGDEYSHLGIPLSFKTISQSVAAFIVPGLYIPPLGITV